MINSEIVINLLYYQNLTKKQVRFFEKHRQENQVIPILTQRFPYKLSDEFIKSLKYGRLIHDIYLHRDLATKLTDEQINIMVADSFGYTEDLMRREDYKRLNKRVLRIFLKELVASWNVQHLVKIYKSMDDGVKKIIRKLIDESWGGFHKSLFIEAIK